MWDRVQTLLGGHGTTSHTLTYASDVIQCGHCDYRITGEQITKKKSGRVYNDYRCTQYNKPGHPRTRVTEVELDTSPTRQRVVERVMPTKITRWRVGLVFRCWRCSTRCGLKMLKFVIGFGQYSRRRPKIPKPIHALNALSFSGKSP